METKQPIWKFLANLGDVNPVDYGGYFIYQDTTGVYPEEAEKLFVEEEKQEFWTVYRFCLDRLKIVTVEEDSKHVAPEGKTYTYLVPFKYDETWSHPVSMYDEWFHDNLDRVAQFIGISLEEMRDMFCSEDACKRAFAYQAIGDYYGYENLDGYPLTFTSREEVESRYQEKGK